MRAENAETCPKRKTKTLQSVRDCVRRRRKTTNGQYYMLTLFCACLARLVCLHCRQSVCRRFLNSGRQRGGAAFLILTTRRGLGPRWAVRQNETDAPGSGFVLVVVAGGHPDRCVRSGAGRCWAGRKGGALKGAEGGPAATDAGLPVRSKLRTIPSENQKPAVSRPEAET